MIPAVLAADLQPGDVLALTDAHSHQPNGSALVIAVQRDGDQVHISLAISAHGWTDDDTATIDADDMVPLLPPADDPAR